MVTGRTAAGSPRAPRAGIPGRAGGVPAGSTPGRRSLGALPSALSVGPGAEKAPHLAMCKVLCG